MRQILHKLFLNKKQWVDFDSKGRRVLRTRWTKPGTGGFKVFLYQKGDLELGIPDQYRSRWEQPEIVYELAK